LDVSLFNFLLLIFVVSTVQVIARVTIFEMTWSI